ncbi:MAG TPA: isocitrate lyase/phosphoenolpyruvate mutase family protein, partial [Mucilaginibacter sp.]
MKNRFEDLLALHKNAEPLLIGNAWNAQSAKIFEQQKFKVIGTSSAAVAESLGYADGQEMSLETYLFIVERIAASVSAILTVDLEAGYGDTPEQIAANIARLYNIGVSGINIEDSIVVDGKRIITDAAAFAEKLKQVIRLLKNENIDMFINLRSDS